MSYGLYTILGRHESYIVSRLRRYAKLGQNTISRSADVVIEGLDGLDGRKAIRSRRAR